MYKKCSQSESSYIYNKSGEIVFKVCDENNFPLVADKTNFCNYGGCIFLSLHELPSGQYPKFHIEIGGVNKIKCFATLNDVDIKLENKQGTQTYYNYFISGQIEPIDCSDNLSQTNDYRKFYDVLKLVVIEYGSYDNIINSEIYQELLR